MYVTASLIQVETLIATENITQGSQIDCPYILAEHLANGSELLAGA